MAAGKFVFHPSKEVSVKIKKAATNYPKALDSKLKTSAENIKNSAKRNASRRTGFLISRIAVEKIKDGYAVNSEAEYSVYHEAYKHYMKDAIDEEMPNIKKIGNVVLKSLGFS